MAHTVTVENQGTVWCAVRTDGEGRIARHWGDTEQEAREGVMLKSPVWKYED